MTQQTEAQRLADALVRLANLEANELADCLNDVAALLRRQDELLEQALEALENSHYDVGSEEKQRLGVMDAITAIRAHREAK